MFEKLQSAAQAQSQQGTSSPAPGKQTRTAGLPASGGSSNSNSAIAGVVLAPDLVEVLQEGDQYEVAEKLRKDGLGKGILDAAFDFIRTNRGPAFVEKVSNILFPRDKNDRDWMGIQDLVDEHVNHKKTDERQNFLNTPVCHEGTPDVDEQKAFSGIQLYIKVPERDLKDFDRMPHPYQFGPDTAGPYSIIPCTFEGRLVGYIAHHSKRVQNEWVIGPDSIDDFVKSVGMYASVATTLLPGAPVVPSSMEDGADKPFTPDSVVKEASRDEAPWQNKSGFDQLIDNMDGNGATAIAAVMNSGLRIKNYVLPAKQLAKRLEAQVLTGELDHLDARSQAVAGRNDLLEDTRKKMTKGAREVSKNLKETGVSLSEMESRKTNELLQGYTKGVDKKGRSIRGRLDADSPLWGQYAKAMEAAGDLDPTKFDHSLQTLGRSREVSMEIIRSAGRPRRWITGIAAANLGVGGALGVLGVEEMIMDIVNADEAHKLHAASREFAGFAGGLLGAEGAIWLASVLIGPGVSTPVMLIVSIMAGVGGSALGSTAGKGVIDLLAEASLGGMMPATALSHRGGLAGVHTSDKHQGQNWAEQITDRIFKLDTELVKYDQSMHFARSAEELDDYRRERVEILSRRGDLEQILTAVKLGAFEDDDQVSKPFSEETVEVSPPPEVPTDLKCDDDCDSAVD